MAKLKEQLHQSGRPQGDWLDEIFGVFDNDPIYQEAMRLGKEYRESLRSGNIEEDEDSERKQ